MKTRETIKKNQDTVKFAEHFKTKSSIKNLLKKIPEAKKLQHLFENPKYGKEILEYSNISDNFDVILSDVFTAYTAQITVWRETGDNRPLSARVDLFKDLLSDRMKRNPGAEIAASLGDFMKSATGKHIDKVLVEAGIKEDNNLYLNIIILVAARAFINNALVEAEEIEPEVENAGHSSTSKKDAENETTELAIVEGLSQRSEEFLKIAEMFENINPNISNDEIRSMVTIIRPYIPKFVDEFCEAIDKEVMMTDKIWHHSVVQRIIKDIDNHNNLDNRVKNLLAFVADVGFEEGNELVMRDLFFIIIDIINHPSDDEHLYEDAKFIVKFKNAEVNPNAFIEEIVDQSTRINNIISEFNAKVVNNTAASAEAPKSPETPKQVIQQESKPNVENETVISTVTTSVNSGICNLRTTLIQSAKELAKFSA